MVRRVKRKSVRKRSSKAGFPFARYAKAAAVSAAAALGLGAMHHATRGAPHNPGRGHTIATVPRASGSNKRTKRKRRGAKGTRKRRRR
jgi:hypothetical protein